ncbi:MAG: Peptidase family U32 [Methanoregulaceae archaeon PtaB.Bin056]|nr:MAG: Peptidase family U32 [Methanoregulaceae archaeon PtaB.Bin056]
MRHRGSLPGAKRECPELLAPAGSKEALQAAVAAGADAVYLGGRKFGARHFAANFSEGEIREAVEYAHLHGVRVYVTVNTLIQDGELKDALGYLLSLYGMGVDAVLLQDPGLLALAREVIPGLDLHASTQCTISTREGVEWAWKAGFSRVVLARETPLSEVERIIAIPRDKRPGIEIFVHGALCYSYSGQCLLSSVIGGRSGNRGMCAQPCRKPYTLLRGVPDPWGRLKDASMVPCPARYLLSTRDLCCYDGLDEIVARRVEALKIEGRMRSPEYVAAVVGAYRRALDALANGEDWHSQDDVEEMAGAFNRGFTKGYLLGEGGPSLMGRDQPDNRGLFLGTVVAAPRGGGVLIRPSSQYLPVSGDGILVVGPSGESKTGYSLHRDAERRGDLLFLPAQVTGVKPGSVVSVTRSRHLRGRLKETVHAGATRFRVPVVMQVRIAEGAPLEGTATCPGPWGGRIEVSRVTGFIPTPAKTAGLSHEAVSRQLRKTGAAPFRVDKVDIDRDGNPFVPLGELNRLRRELLAGLKEAWLGGFLPEKTDFEKAGMRVRKFLEADIPGIPHGNARGHKKPLPVLTLYCATPRELQSACSAGCDAICYEPSVGSWEGYFRDLCTGFRYCSERNVSYTWKWPRITGRSFLQEALLMLPDLFGAGVRRIMVEEAGMAEAILSREPRMEVTGGQGLNIYNACAAQAFHPPISLFTLSPELSSSQAATLLALSARTKPQIRYEIICQGNLDAIVSEDRLLSTLVVDRPILGSEAFGIRDETGRTFPVYEDRLGRTHVLNAVETTLVDRIPQLSAMGVHSLVVDARGRGEHYVAVMAALYREGIGAVRSGNAPRSFWQHLVDRARAISRGGITAGHFDRGVAGYGDPGAE